MFIVENFGESVGESVTLTIYASDISQTLYFVQGIIASVQALTQKRLSIYHLSTIDLSAIDVKLSSNFSM